jgi:nucleotide-binding universal stress UspA family protein
MMFRRILVPTDFSERSRSALQFAVGLARLSGAQIDLLHVVPSPGRVATAIDAYAGLPLPATPEPVLQDARERLDDFLASIDHLGVTVHCRVESGDPAASICTLAAEQPDDLIVVGTHGRSGLAEVLLGSVAKKLISTAPCPVVALRPGPSPSIQPPA